jgi:hypothetical protein
LSWGEKNMFVFLEEMIKNSFWILFKWQILKERF